MRPHDQGGVKWRFCSGLLWKAGVFPSQGTAPISPLFSRAQFLVCFGAGQQGSSEYSLAKEGWPRTKQMSPFL